MLPAIPGTITKKFRYERLVGRETRSHYRRLQRGPKRDYCKSRCDLCFRSARFEVKELMDDCRRYREYKAHH